MSIHSRVWFQLVDSDTGNVRRGVFEQVTHIPEQVVIDIKMKLTAGVRDPSVQSLNMCALPQHVAHGDGGESFKGCLIVLWIDTMFRSTGVRSSGLQHGHSCDPCDILDHVFFKETQAR